VDLTYSPREEAFRRDVRTWLEANVPREPWPSGDTAEGFALHRLWEKRLFDAGWAVVSWPKKYGGREASLVEWLVFEEEYYRAGAPQRIAQGAVVLNDHNPHRRPRVPLAAPRRRCLRHGSYR